MIRAVQKADLNTVADIWLNTNLSAHSFLPAQYWFDHYEPVKEMLAHAELYVYEAAEGIQGFIGMQDSYIAGLFVRQGAQSRGIGTHLLDFVKEKQQPLRLSVYEKNHRAIRFYQNAGFSIQSKNIEEQTGEAEYSMLWQP